MSPVTLPEIQSEYDVWNVSPVYWVRVTDWALVGGYERELSLYKVALNQYPDEGPTYRTAQIGMEPPARGVDPVDLAARLAYAHKIVTPDWLAPSLAEIVRLLNLYHWREG